MTKDMDTNVANNSVTENLTEKREDRTMAEVKNNQTVATNSTIKTLLGKEDTKMKENRFVKAMMAEEEAKNAAQEAANAQAEADRIAAIVAAEAEANAKLIEGITPNKIMQTMEDVAADRVAPAETYVGTRGDHWIDNRFQYQGHTCFAAGQSPEEVAEDTEAIKIAIARGDVILPVITIRGMGTFEISGRYVTKVIAIPDAISDCLTIGRTEAERKENEKAARIQAAKLPGVRMVTDPPVAKDANEAQLPVTDEIEKYDNRYMVIEDKTARDFNGNLVADISDIDAPLPHNVAVELLKGRIEEPVVEESDEDECYDEEEGYEDECYNEDDEY